MAQIARDPGGFSGESAGQTKLFLPQREKRGGRGWNEVDLMRSFLSRIGIGRVLFWAFRRRAAPGAPGLELGGFGVRGCCFFLVCGGECVGVRLRALGRATAEGKGGE